MGSDALQILLNPNSSHLLLFGIVKVTLPTDFQLSSLELENNHCRQTSWSLTLSHTQ